MQVVANPNGKGVENIEWRPVDISQRSDARPYITHDILALAEDLEAGYQPQYQDDDGNGAKDSHQITCASETMNNAVNIRARFGQKVQEHGRLIDKDDDRQQDDDQRVHHALTHHRAQGFGKRCAVALLQRTAACHLADAGYDKARSVRQEYRIDTSATSGVLVEWCQCNLPAQCADDAGQNAKKQGQSHPSPVHLVKDSVCKVIPIGITVHPPQDAYTKGKREENLEYVFENLWQCFLSI